mmetsp:Transcript_38969/g.77374  ORF Transcript_38969/g.77374 Transcript_38969/m.77374 type:complete len:659 (+) Transcript_38969:84-2060(+)
MEATWHVAFIQNPLSAPAQTLEVSDRGRHWHLAARDQRNNSGSHASLARSSNVASAASLCAAATFTLTACASRSKRRARQRTRRRHVALPAAAVAEVRKLGSLPDSTASVSSSPEQKRPRPLQIVKIDLETNKVVIGEEELAEVQEALRRTGCTKVSVVGVMGAFRTGKSFLLDLMLRYLRYDGGKSASGEITECDVPAWMIQREVPEWVVECGGNLSEGREGRGTQELQGFVWRPGMEKCTQGVWVWSEAFVRKAGNEDVALLLMDTQGAWDAQMTKEQSATVFGLTTLMTSRLIYNVSKQIQQDKIDNLLYFTDFAQAALRASGDLNGSRRGDDSMRPFQTLDFLVRDWPHFSQDASVASGREMMVKHLDQYMVQSEDMSSVESLRAMFENIDVWCLPHPSLQIERETWDGDLSVVDAEFWRFLNTYMTKIFSPEQLKANTTVGEPLTVDSFCAVLTEFTRAFQDAAPQAKTFAQAMETSTSLLARDVALKLFKRSMRQRMDKGAMSMDDFDKLASDTANLVQIEFSSRALFGSDEGIASVNEALKESVAEETQNLREENERMLEQSLASLTDVSLVALGAFGLDKFSDISCDWWSDVCRDLSNDLAIGYYSFFAFLAFNVYNIQKKEGNLTASVAAAELFKNMVKRVTRMASGTP